VSVHHMRIRSILKSSVMFTALTEPQLDTLADIGELRLVPEGKLLCFQHRPPKGLFVVGMGRVKVFQLSPEGKEFIIRIIGTGSTFAAAATLGQFECPALAVAMERSEMVFLPGEPFLAVLARDNVMCMVVLKSMAQYQCELIQMLENVVLRDSLGRLSGYLRALAGDRSEGSARVIKLPIKKRDLAAYLALTPETVSRTLARLVDLKAIRCENGSEIEVLSLETLEEFGRGLRPVRA